MERSLARPMGPLATLDSAAVNEGSYMECFSDHERQHILGTRHARRRGERLAGRLAAKYLFLSQDDALPALLHLTPAHLDRYSALTYRSTEIFRSDEVSSGLPRIGWSGHSLSQGVAISHTNGVACAFLGTGEEISVDMERAELRTSTFYAGNFTAFERSWIADLSTRLCMDPSWMFTFLWTTKECLLKTPCFRDLSLADLPSINVRITSGEEQLVHPHSARDFLAGFVFLQADVADASRMVQVNLAVSGRHDLVLTAVERRIA
jgi:hypothetical protein